MMNEERVDSIILMLLCVHSRPLLDISNCRFSIFRFEILCFEKLNKTLKTT